MVFQTHTTHDRLQREVQSTPVRFNELFTTFGGGGEPRQVESEGGAKDGGGRARLQINWRRVKRQYYEVYSCSGRR